MSQYGGGRLGSVPLNPGGTVAQTFQTLSHGAIETLFITVQLSLISSATAFNLAVSSENQAAAEGADDLDKLLDSLFTLLAVFFDAEHLTGVMKMSQWRTVLGGLNKRDFDGSLQNGIQIPATGGTPKAFRITIPFPVALTNYFEDGGIFRNGALRLMDGRAEYTCGPTLTPTVTLANGSAVVSGVNVSISDSTGPGTEADVGNFWRAERKPNLPTDYEVQDDFTRLLILDAEPSTTNAATNYNVGDFSLWTPGDFQAKFQSERLVDGGYDLSNRSTPLVWLDRGRAFLDFAAGIGKKPKIQAVSGVSSLTLYEVTMHPPPAPAIQKVSQKVAAGGPVSLEHPTPKSLPPGTPVPPVLVNMLPVRIRPGNAGVRAGEVAPSPEAAGVRQVEKAVVQQRISKFAQLFRK